MVIFGVLNFGSFDKVDMGIVDEADNEASHRFIAELERIDALKIFRGSSLAEGDRHLVLVFPSTLGRSPGPTELVVLYNPGRPQEVQVGRSPQALHPQG